MEELSHIVESLSPHRLETLKHTEGVVRLVLDVSGMNDDAAQALEEKVRAALLQQTGVAAVRIAMTRKAGGADSAENHTKPQPKRIAIASGKGGVGKSTLSANLAVQLAAQGYKIGLIDADIYGPSQPLLFGVEGVKPEADGKQLIPVPTPSGVGLLSIGQMVADGQAIAWRGPMAGNALSQLANAQWDGYDALLIDMPPGTGDVQLTMVQQHKPDGAVIICTPQDLALIDARRAINFFEKTHVPMIGLVENMAGYLCPHCGEASYPFGSGGAQEAASALGLPFLGRIPLRLEIREGADAGITSVESEGAAHFATIAQSLGQWLKNQA
jgi:ATP-binding protein involved in chromosome partitioning